MLDKTSRACMDGVDRRRQQVSTEGVGIGSVIKNRCVIFEIPFPSVSQFEGPRGGRGRKNLHWLAGTGTSERARQRGADEGAGRYRDMDSSRGASVL